MEQFFASALPTREPSGGCGIGVLIGTETGGGAGGGDCNGDGSRVKNEMDGYAYGHGYRYLTSGGGEDGTGTGMLGNGGGGDGNGTMQWPLNLLVTAQAEFVDRKMEWVGVGERFRDDDDDDEGVAGASKWMRTDSGPFQSIVIVIVGPDATEFAVHQHLLRQESFVFRNRFDGSPDCNMLRHPVILADVDEGVFQTFLQWLYHDIGLSPGTTSGAGKSGGLNSPNNNKQKYTFAELVEAYLLGEKLEAPVFLNVVVDGIVGLFKTNKKVPAALAERIYEQTKPESLLRSLYLTLCAWGDAAGKIQFTRMDILQDLIDRQKQLLKDGSRVEFIKAEDFYVVETSSGRCKEREILFAPKNLKSAANGTSKRGGIVKKEHSTMTATRRSGRVRSGPAFRRLSAP
ncbi:hypothetical protein FQN50_002888 [Emmonsiellopsis sp. PD_5]|nr:hypothetical protein FQN50_002888 [Emmonsiellopsis sp. PD_5]